MSKGETKWNCEVCTFENWPSSVKCTMCRTKKPSVKEDIYSLREHQQEKILEIDAEGYLEEIKDYGTARAVTPDVLWSCSACTFLNKESEQSCFQCESKKSSDDENLKKKTSNHIKDKDDHIRISKSNSQNLGFIEPKTSMTKSNSQVIENDRNKLKSDKKERSSPRSSEKRERNSPNLEKKVSRDKSMDTISPQNIIIETKSRKNRNDIDVDNNKISDNECRLNDVSKTLKIQSDHRINKSSQNINDERNINLEYSVSKTKDKNSYSPNQTLIKGQLSSISQKWPCQHCTYENWPKSLKCVMCGLGHNPFNQAAGGAVKNSPMNSPERDSARGGYSVSLNDENLLTSVRRSNSRRFEQTEINNANIQHQTAPNNCEYERRLRLSRQADWSWLDACVGVVEGDPNPVEAYLSSGGDPTRYLTASEAFILNRPSAFDTGHTLVHLAIRFHREDMLATLLSQIEGSGSGVKRVPSYVAPDLAADIRRHISTTIRQRKGSFPCYFVTEMTTFALPAEVEDLPTTVQDQLFEELLDKEVQSQLESDPAVVNWSLEITVQLGSRLYALWNRSAGDCLLDSVMQATWGVFDRENVLRRALSESLHQGGHLFFPRWKEYESSQASLLHFSLDETQYEEDWAGLLSLASQPGSSLDQLHVFALAHILRRPIIVYGVKYVKSFRGETLGYARFEGVYLPLLWEQSFCIRSPLALGYTRGHFSALVPLEPYSRLDCSTSISGANNIDESDQLMINFLPLMDRDRKLLPVHFLTQSEMGREENILRQWMDICITEGGIMVAQQKLHKRPLLVAQLLEEWLNHYRRLEQMSQAPFSTRTLPVQEYSSEGETDDE